MKTTTVERACKLIQGRANVGQVKYGVSIDRDDLTASDWAQHALEEMLDGAQYLIRLKDEMEALQEENAELKRELSVKSPELSPELSVKSPELKRNQKQEFKSVCNAIDIELEMDVASSKGWLPLNKWIASGKLESDWIDYCEFNRVGRAIKLERESKIKNNKKSKKKNEKIKQSLTDEIGLLKNIIKNSLTIQDYLASKEKELDLIEQLDK